MKYTKKIANESVARTSADPVWTTRYHMIANRTIFDPSIEIICPMSKNINIFSEVLDGSTKKFYVHWL